MRRSLIWCGRPFLTISKLYSRRNTQGALHCGLVSLQCPNESLMLPPGYPVVLPWCCIPWSVTYLSSIKCPCYVPCNAALSVALFFSHHTWSMICSYQLLSCMFLFSLFLPNIQYNILKKSKNNIEIICSKVQSNGLKKQAGQQVMTKNGWKFQAKTR